MDATIREHDERSREWREFERLAGSPTARRLAREMAERHARAATGLRKAIAAPFIAKRRAVVEAAGKPCGRR